MSLLIVPIILGIVSTTVILLWSIGLGWVLTQIFHFTLFEGSLLGMMASFFAVYLWFRIVNGPPSTINPDDYEEIDLDDEANDLINFDIPVARFAKTAAQKTWANWLRFVLANNIYLMLRSDSHTKGLMDTPQLQELSIRLADTGVALLRKVSPRTKRIKLTPAGFSQEMTRQGLKPYDDMILGLAIAAINTQMMMPESAAIVHSKLWDKRTTLFEDWE